MSEPTRSLSRFQAAALECLYQHRLLTTTQIVRLLTPSASSSRFARCQLGQLADLALVDAVTTGHQHEKAWFTTGTGAAVAETGQIRSRGYRMTRLKAAGPSQRHTLAVNEVGLAFVEAARSRGEECSPLDWTPEVAHRLADGLGHRFDDDHLIVDAVLHYVMRAEDSRRVQLRFFIELDRATMSAARLADKLARYGRYYEYTPSQAGSGHRTSAGDVGRRAWRERYPRFPKVLVILTGKPEQLLHARIADVRALCAEDLRLRRLSEELPAGATTLAQLLEHGPFAPIITPLLAREPASMDTRMVVTQP